MSAGAEKGGRVIVYHRSDETEIWEICGAGFCSYPFHRNAPGSRATLRVVPLSQKAANAFIVRHHRHHGQLPGGFAWWAVGVVAAERVVGVALAGRPTNRNNDDGQTVEVQRVATDGTPNACSALYGSCARAAKAIGARRIITYTLDEESGASLRGAGWVREADGIKSWWTSGSSRTKAVDRPHMAKEKVRWALTFRDAVFYYEELPPVSDSRQGELIP
jgi:hypothetical protein